MPRLTEKEVEAIRRQRLALGGFWGNNVDDLLDTIDAIQADCAAMREALTQIAQGEPACINSDNGIMQDSCDVYQALARTALAELEGK